MPKIKKNVSGEGTTYRLEDGRYVWKCEVGGRLHVVKRRDYTAFVNEVARRKKEIQEKGHGAAKQDKTLNQFAPDWIEAFLAPPRKSNKTYKLYLGSWRNHIKPALGKVKLSKLSITHVQGWITDMHRNGVGYRSLEVAFVALKKIVDGAVADGYVTKNPCLSCELPKKPPAPPMRVLSAEEVAGLLGEAYSLRKRGRASRYRHLFRFALSSGLRISEILGLQRINCDFRKGVVHVRQQLEWLDEGKWQLIPTKSTASNRTIVLQPAAKKALRQMIAQVEKEKRDPDIFDYVDNGLVFCRINGQPAFPRNIQRQLDSFLERATWIDEDGREITGIPHCGLHDLRRTCLTNLANRGLPMHQLKAYAGHSNIATTAKYYIGVNVEAQRAAMDLLLPEPQPRAKKTFGT